jgi:hypothetical protein
MISVNNGKLTKQASIASFMIYKSRGEWIEWVNR